MGVSIKREDRELKGRIRALLLCLLIPVLFLLLTGCGKREEPVAASASETSGAPSRETAFEPPVVYHGKEIIDGAFNAEGVTYPFKYSDGFFDVDPKYYQTHMATASQALSYAASNPDARGDYSVCADEVVSILEQIGFSSVYVSPSFTTKPTSDSVGCVIAEKTVSTGRGARRILSMTMKSGSFEKEWALDFIIGDDGEARGAASSAERVIDEYLAAYLSLHPDLIPSLDAGEVDFWLQGFSRGGAVANLVAKRLIDRYQAAGNGVYAYCIEAPKAGIKSAEDPTRDYSSIHNVVNPNDPVPYLAPAAMGFKRYGLDHYLFSGYANSDDPIRDESGRAVSDNERFESVTEKRLALTRKRLLALLGSEWKADLFMPRGLTFWELDLATETVRYSERAGTTPSFLETVFDGICVLKNGEPVTDRATYQTSGMEAALARLVAFLMTDLDPADLPSTDVLQPIAEGAFASCRDALSRCSFLNDRLKPSLNLHGQVARDLSDALILRLREEAFVSELFSDYPEGGVEKALDDLSVVLYRVLYATEDVDDLLTLVLNFADLSVNHQYVLTLAVLESYDSWFDPAGTD